MLGPQSWKNKLLVKCNHLKSLIYLWFQCRKGIQRRNVRWTDVLADFRVMNLLKLVTVTVKLVSHFYKMWNRLARVSTQDYKSIWIHYDGTSKNLNSLTASALCEISTYLVKEIKMGLNVSLLYCGHKKVMHLVLFIISCSIIYRKCDLTAEKKHLFSCASQSHNIITLSHYFSYSMVFNPIFNETKTWFIFCCPLFTFPSLSFFLFCFAVPLLQPTPLP